MIQRMWRKFQKSKILQELPEDEKSDLPNDEVDYSQTTWVEYWDENEQV